jgi:hypothetical protein
MGFGLEFILPAALSAASSIGGALMNANAAQQANQNAMMAAQARNQQLAEYRARMQALQEQSQAANQKAQQIFGEEDTQKRETDANKQLNDQYSTAIQTQPGQAATSEIPLAGSTPSIVRDSYAKAGEGAQNYSKMLASRLAQLGTQSQSLNQSGVGVNRQGSLVDMYGNFGKQETALLPNYQDFASTYWKLKPSNSGMGSALSGLGGALSKIAGANWG